MYDANGPCYNIDDIVQDMNGRCEATHFESLVTFTRLSENVRY